jgi:hypothetical protein
MLEEERLAMNREFRSSSTITQVLGGGAALLATVAIVWSMEALADHIYVEQEKTANTQSAIVAHHDPASAYGPTVQPGQARTRSTPATAVHS